MAAGRLLSPASRGNLQPRHLLWGGKGLPPSSGPRFLLAEEPGGRRGGGSPWAGGHLRFRRLPHHVLEGATYRGQGPRPGGQRPGGSKEPGGTRVTWGGSAPAPLFSSRTGASPGS